MTNSLQHSKNLNKVLFLKLDLIQVKILKELKIISRNAEKNALKIDSNGRGNIDDSFNLELFYRLLY